MEKFINAVEKHSDDILQTADYVWKNPETGYKEIKTKKCSLWPDDRCEYADDGYCFDLPRHINCKHIVEVTEYALNDNKRIWKEFE